MATTLAYSSATVGLQRWLFTLALLLATWIPMLFFVAVGSVAKPTGGLEAVKAALLYVGGVHVAATLILYLDKTFAPLIRENKVRYIYVPLALVLASGFIFTVGGAVVQVSTYLVFWAWQAHHYGRQNIGVYSFAAMARGWRPHPLERRALVLAAACGIGGTFKVLAKEVAPSAMHPLFDALYQLSAVAFLGVLAFSVYVYVKRRADFSSSRTAFFFTLVCFFLPMFLSDNLDVAFFSYAIAHGTQYLAFMAVISLDLGARDGRQGVSSRMVAIAAFLVVLGLIGYRAADVRAFAPIAGTPLLTHVIDFLAGIGLGTTIAHFVIDAGAWKLSQSSAKRYVTQRFGFLFEGASTRT
jgi:hypothetical protein